MNRNRNKKNRVEYLPYKGFVDLRLYALEDKDFDALWAVQVDFFTKNKDYEHKLKKYDNLLKFIENMKRSNKTFVPDEKTMDSEKKSADDATSKFLQEKAQYEKSMKLLIGKEIKNPELL